MQINTERRNKIRDDLFNAIEYEVRSCGKRHTVTGKTLGGQFVFAWTFRDAWNFISAGIATADRYKFHSAKALFNNADVWTEHDKSIQIAIGRCLAYFVEKKMLPLSCVNPHQSNKLYAVLDH
jgi:hypothetical protein